jgi:hypothetical protein
MRSPDLNGCHTRLLHRLHTHANDLAPATRVGSTRHPPLRPFVYQTVTDLELCGENFDYLRCWWSRWSRDGKF